MIEPVYPRHAIAIVGMAGRFPGARTLDEFWENVRSGADCFQTFDEQALEEARVPRHLRADSRYVRGGTVLEDADAFDEAYFAMSPREAQLLDPQQRIFLECALSALENAGYGAGAPDCTVGVYGGAGMNTYLLAQVLRNPALAEAAGGYQLMLGNDKDFLCTRVSYKLDLKGPSLTIQTACSTSLVAIAVACRALHRGECDMALAGGVSVNFPQRAGYLYQEGMILSPDGRCRPFDLDAHGTRPGAGAGIVVLKRLADAVSDGDTVHAIIRGAAVNNDGADKTGYTAPSIDGQVEVIATAQTLAEVHPRTIGYIEAHGTGTQLGDPIEVAALTTAFRAATDDVGFCRLGSLKANLGHLDVAAGVAGLIKAVLVLKNGYLPPLTHFRSPNPQLDLEQSPFCASGKGSDWESREGPRRAGVSSFGIGGTNAHVVLEEAPAAVPSEEVGPEQLLVVSARTHAALRTACCDLADHLDRHDDASLLDASWTLKAGRRPHAHRRAVVAASRAEAARALRQAQVPAGLEGMHEVGSRPVAFLFSGQGSQHARMGEALYRREPAYRAAFDRCAEGLAPHLGLDLRTIVLEEGHDEPLRQTGLAQPALFATSYALSQLWRAWGVQPWAMMGHSIGEYVAAHLAGVFSLEDALAIVAARGRLMQALPPGAMAAVSLPMLELQPFLTDEVGIAAVNASCMCAISGPTDSVAEIVRRLETSGVDARLLHTSHAFHSPMMEPARAAFVTVLKGISLSPPQIRYVSNVTGRWITAEEATSPAYYGRHLRETVRFEAGLRTLAAESGAFVLEVGPGNSLTTLAQVTLPSASARHAAASLPHPRARRCDMSTILEAAGRLWVSGATLDWAAMRGTSVPRRIPLPTYPFERRRHFVEAMQDGHGGAAQDAALQTFAPVWTLAKGQPERLHGPWLVLGGPDTLSREIGDQLAPAGAVVVRLGSRDGESACFSADIRDAIRAMSDIAGVVVLPPADAAAPSYSDLLAIAEILPPQRNGESLRVLVASFGAQAVLDEPADPDAHLSLGPILALPSELPGLEMRSVDLDGAARGRLSETASALLDEAVRPQREPIVARRHAQRFLRRFEPILVPSADEAARALTPRGAYLITGGLGGLGLQLARWLGQATQGRLLLTSRTPLPPRETWADLVTQSDASRRDLDAIAAIREVESSGGEVMVMVADAADRDAMAVAIGAAQERWGPLSGIIHSAGIPGRGVVAARMSDQDFRATLAPKVSGLGVLVDLLGEAPLDFVVLMSSINAVIGAAGTCDYGSANAYLDAFAESGNTPRAWRRVVSVNWSAWRDVGMAANLKVAAAGQAAWRAAQANGIPPEAGARMLGQILASDRNRIVVSTFDLAEVTAKLRDAGHVERAPDGEPVERPSSPKPGDPDSALAEGAGSLEERRLAAIWSELLGLDTLDLDDDFFALGGHSLLATRVLARIGETTGSRLTLRDIFEAPTVRELALRIQARPVDGVLAGEEREEFLI